MDLSDRSVSELFRAGYRLRLPCEATAVSVKLFHEFAGDSDITLLPVDELNLAITTCLFLAAKLEVSVAPLPPLPPPPSPLLRLLSPL